MKAPICLFYQDTNWRASCKKLVSDFLGQIFVLVQMSSIFACDFGLNGKTLPRSFFCCFVFRFQEIFLNQHWQQMRAALILLFGKTKAFFGKDTARKKMRFFIRYLWKRKEKPANLNRGVCFSMKWKATCQNWAHLDEEKNFGLKCHLRASCTKPFNYSTKLFGVQQYGNQFYCLQNTDINLYLNFYPKTRNEMQVRVTTATSVNNS